MTIALDVSGLKKSFGGVAAVKGADFSVAAGEAVALIGPNGAGKTTTFNLINGQLKPDAGRVSLHGAEITGNAPEQLFRLGVARTFQITATFASMSVRENVQMALLSFERGAHSVVKRAAHECSRQADAFGGTGRARRRRACLRRLETSRIGDGIGEPAAPVVDG